jgi:MoxR-like ATPase
MGDNRYAVTLFCPLFPLDFRRSLHLPRFPQSTVSPEERPRGAATTNGNAPMKFEGTERYVATEDLRMAVNAAVTLQRPLLIKGEPGTGKTLLAEEVAQALNMPLLTWHIKSTTKAQQGLYEYDAVSRLRDSQLGNEKVNDIANYIKRGKLWDAFASAADRAADRRDRQGRHRVPERPAARARSHGILRLRNRRDDSRAAPSGHHHHQQQ